MENKEAFLQEMQKQCLTDGLEHITSMHEALLQLEKNAAGAISELMKASHNLKGNFQAVGFPHCSAFIHRFETVLAKLEAGLGGGPLVPDDARALEFFLSDVVGQLQSYFSELASEADCEAFAKKRDFVFTIFDTWKTQGPSGGEAIPLPAAPVETPASVPVPAPAPAEPVVEAKTVPAAETASAPDPVAVVAAPPEAGPSIFLICRNGSFNFALRVEKVVEIVRFPEVNPLPYSQDSLLGLMNLRGDVIPVLNLREIDQGEKAKQLAVICRTDAGKFGVPVESADCVMEIDSRKFQSAEKSFGERENSLVRSVYMEGEHPIFVIEVEKALAS